MPTKKQDPYDKKIKALEKKLAEIEKTEEKVEDEYDKKIKKLEQELAKARTAEAEEEENEQDNKLKELQGELADLKEDVEEDSYEPIPPPSRYREPSSSSFWVSMFAGGFGIGTFVLWLFRVGAFFYLWDIMASGFWGFLQTVFGYIVIHFIAQLITYLIILVVGGIAAFITKEEDAFYVTGVILFPILHTIFIWLLVGSVVTL
jgi:hypothetical protein